MTVVGIGGFVVVDGQWSLWKILGRGWASGVDVCWSWFDGGVR